MNKTDIKIKSKKWYDLHNNTLTASGLYKIFKDPIQFINNEIYRNDIDKDIVYWGTELEPVIFNTIKTKWDGYEEVINPELMYESNIGNDLYYFSLDGIIENKKIIEIKTTSLFLKFKTVFSHYGFRQCLWYNILTDLPVELFIFQANKLNLLGTIDKNLKNYQQLKDLLIYIFKTANDLLNHNQKIDNNHKLIEAINHFNNLTSEEPKIEKLNSIETRDKLERYFEIKTEVLALTKEKKEIEAKIKVSLDEKQVKYNNHYIWVENSTRKGSLNAKRLQADILKYDMKIDDYRGATVNFKSIKVKKVKKINDKKNSQ